MPKEEQIFGPHEGETYRHYRSRLKDDQSMTGSRAAALMATALMMQGKPNQPVDREQFHKLTRKLRKQPAFRQMMRDNKAKALLRSGNGSGLIQLMADTETVRQHSFDRYIRPREYVKEDAKVLKSAIEGLKKHAPAEGAAAAGSPELEQQGKLYREMMKRLEHAQSLADSGIQLSGESTKQLITAVKAYNDGGKAIPGGDKKAEGHLEAMTLLSRYMPAKDFQSYCVGMNDARGLTNRRQEGYTDPEAFPAERLTEGAKTAKELYAESQIRLMMTFSIEGCAEATAIRKLSGGNPNRVIRQEDLDREVKNLCTPGSAFVRAMQDDKAREEYMHLAAAGGPEELGTDLLAAARQHSARTAQWQVNRSIRELTSGPVNAYVAADNLANILAARELALSDNLGEPITNGAFRARAERMKADPAFQQLAASYSEDPVFRRRMNGALPRNNGAETLKKVYEQIAAVDDERRASQEEARRREQERDLEQQQQQPALV